MTKKISIKKGLKLIFSGFSIFFIASLFIMTIHDVITGESLTTTEYCKKYGFLASPDCW